MEDDGDDAGALGDEEPLGGEVADYNANCRAGIGTKELGHIDDFLFHHGDSESSQIAASGRVSQGVRYL